MFLRHATYTCCRMVIFVGHGRARALLKAHERSVLATPFLSTLSQFIKPKAITKLLRISRVGTSICMALFPVTAILHVTCQVNYILQLSEENAVSLFPCLIGLLTWNLLEAYQHLSMLPSYSCYEQRGNVRMMVMLHRNTVC